MNRRQFLGTSLALPLAAPVVAEGGPHKISNGPSPFPPRWSRDRTVEILLANQQRAAPQFAHSVEEFWLRTPLFDFVSVQPMTGPTDTIYYLKQIDNDVVIRQDLIAAVLFPWRADDCSLEDSVIDMMWHWAEHHVVNNVKTPDEMHRSFLHNSEALHGRTGRGGANWIVAHPCDSNLIWQIAGFESVSHRSPEKSRLVKVGTLNHRFKVFLSDQIIPHTLLMGYMGDTSLDSGIVVAPYIHQSEAKCSRTGFGFLNRSLWTKVYF